MPKPSSALTPEIRSGRLVAPGSFEQTQHFYPRVLNAHIHPLVAAFFRLDNRQIAARYVHLHPHVDGERLGELLAYRPRHFAWAGSDLLSVTSDAGQHQMVVVETNSCPSGQKSMPLLHDSEESGGYRTVLRSAFSDLLDSTDVDGGLAVVYDKNPMEASGYAAALAAESGEHVWLAEHYDGDADPPVRWAQGVMHVRGSDGGGWRPIRACLRYVTQRPWARIPLGSRTRVLNPVVACLAGGRNKTMAARAYEMLNAELQPHGLAVRVPETAYNVARRDIPQWIHRMGGRAVIKNPYSNAGQGVWTVATPADMHAFMRQDQRYDKFIVQSLVGNASWSSDTAHGRLYHAGTVPNRLGQIYASDIRIMVAGAHDGFRPVSIYARRAREPLPAHLDSAAPSWDALGTNLSVRNADGSWATDASRLVLMDSKDFNQLGIGTDDLIDGYIQTVLSVIAIDKLCQRLLASDGSFDHELFGRLNPDDALLDELVP
ncbi:hypothetical protein IWW50_004773 [Coemansia erecta]|nr:hypothetical protein GGF43_003411 [Coemansia sp. RSA 2618]KAJ2821114.1 hypothetical protein IWW50_004773 [Coemansia erecta]